MKKKKTQKTEQKTICSTTPSACGITSDSTKIYTSSDLEKAKTDQKTICQTTPSGCGITTLFSATDIATAKDEGKKLVTSNPSMYDLYTKEQYNAAKTTAATTTTSTTGSNASNRSVQILSGAWNMVSVAGYSSYDPDYLFKSKDSSGNMATTPYVKAVYYYDPNIANYKSYQPGSRANTLTKVEPGMGLWVKSNYAFTLKFSSDVVTESATLVDGDGNQYTPPTIK